MHADGSQKHWEKIVSDGVARFVSEHAVDKPGPHTLKFWALDPGLVLERLVIDGGGLQPSYLGPPESPRAASASVALAAATPGLDESGTFTRVDGVSLPIRAVRDRGLPTEGERLAALLSRIEASS